MQRNKHDAVFKAKVAWNKKRIESYLNESKLTRNSFLEGWYKHGGK